MTTVVLTTTDLEGSTGSVTQTGGNAEDTLDDGSDSTGLTMTVSPTTGFEAFLQLGTFSLSTGRLKSWLVTYRRSPTLGTLGLRTSIGSDAANDFGVIAQIFETVGPANAGGGPVATVSSAAQVPPSYTQAQIDALFLSFYADPATAATVLVTEMLVSVTYAVAPVANLTYPVGSPTLTLTSTPTATWTHAAGSDGGPQAAYQLKAFTPAVYGGGGFSPDTSVAAYDSGVVTSNANSAPVGPLANSLTFKVYLRTAQSVNGSFHWSAWDNEIVSTNFTPATVATLTATADPNNGAIIVTATHGGAAWVDVEFERSDDAGVTWVPVRGGTKTTAVDPNFVTAWSSSAVTIHDYEAPQGVNVEYRARASTALITGAYIAPITTSWTSAQPRTVWLKDPNDPSLNMILDVIEFPQPIRPITQGIFPIIGGRAAVVVSDVRRLRTGSLVGWTNTNEQGERFDTAIENPFKLLQFPAEHLWGSKYIALGDVQEMFVDRSIDLYKRSWQIPFTEIERPADQTDY